MSIFKSFEPCLAKSVDYPTIFREHICNTLKRPQDWKNVEPTFVRMASIRNNFDWKKLTKSEQFMSPEMRTIQDSIEEYLK
jgi:hypothetical protein